MHTLFISDLHLGADYPRGTKLFLHFLQVDAARAQALYILGDLFEYWAGDDDLDDPLHRKIIAAMQQLSESGCKIYIMHGNRDLLMQQELARACGATLLSDPTLIELYGKPTLLMHGDLLCTDDHAYQAYRKQVHDQAWQRQFLSQPLATRKAFIAQLRAKSKSEKQNKSSEIMDVNAEAVIALLREHRYPNLIHGHTHRMGRHVLHIDDHTCERWVLGDWNEQGYALRCSSFGCEWVTVNLPSSSRS